jgi:type II secretory pathway component PulL
MSVLKNKSEINTASAELLHQKGNYPSVCHCAYYSNIQLMKHIWLNKLNKTEDELSVLNKTSPTKGSHEVLINQITIHLKQKSIDSRAFNTDILSLKKLRTKADYLEETIGYTQSNNSITLSKSVNLVLNKCL